MPATFSRTLRYLEADGAPRRGIGLLLALPLTGLAAWFLFGRVTVYEVSTQARLEVKSAAHPVAARVAGQIAATRLRIGKQVQEGEVLVVLDAAADRLALAERQTRRDALRAKLGPLRREIRAERAAGRVQREAQQVAIAEARARIAEAEALAKYAERRAETVARLRAKNAAADLEVQQSQAEAAAGRATVRARLLARARLEKDRTVQESERQARLARLEREAADLEGEIAVEVAAVRRLEHAIELHTVRAPVAGRVGESAELRVGSVVQAGDRLGTVVPAGEPRAVALFPAAAVGRVRPGQPARLRLEGFPWTRYGTIPATVVHVGDEPSAGVVRVELTLPPDLATAVPLAHGLPGSVEVAVERLSPAALALRAAGQFLGVKRPPPGRGDRTEP
jgi:membrane fusion protein (multidrug efflux system)